MKFFLKSKTVIGIVVSLLPQLLPELGISFSQDDAQLVNSFMDQAVQAAGAAFAVYGRFAAGGVTVRPFQ